MKLRSIALISGLVILLFSSTASAGWLYASSFQYFDATGHVVGQSLLSCSTSTPRKFSGVKSTYWRQDSILCSDLATLAGWDCFYTDGPGGYPTGPWDCAPHYEVYQSGGKVINDVDRLPPNMTLETSCQKVGCDVRATQFIQSLAAGAVTDFNNSSVPIGATDPVQ